MANKRQKRPSKNLRVWHMDSHTESDNRGNRVLALSQVEDDKPSTLSFAVDEPDLLCVQLGRW